MTGAEANSRATPRSVLHYGPMPVELPNVDPKRKLARKLFDALISKIPFVGGPYAAMRDPPIARREAPGSVAG